jgi:hypothetical protein
MSIDLEHRLRTWYASAPQATWPIQTLDISHSAMSKTFHCWREPYFGTTWLAGIEREMDPCNIEIKLAGSSANLDQKFDIRLGLVDVDTQDVFRDELDRIPIDTQELIRLVYCEYLSDDLTAPQATVVLQAESISYVQGAASISAVSPRYNMQGTGELYTPKLFPMLRGFL